MDTVIDNIEMVIPHRGAMKLIERVIAFDEQHIKTTLTVPLDGPFHDPQGVPAWIGLEYMAQTIGAWSGALARLHGKEPRIGFLLGTRQFSTKVGHFAPCADLTVQALVEFYDEKGLGMFNCTIFGGHEQASLATAMISVYQPDDEQLADLIANAPHAS